MTILTLALALRNHAVHHGYCRPFVCCKPDWVEAIALGLLRPRCKNCQRSIP